MNLWERENINGIVPVLKLFVSVGRQTDRHIESKKPTKFKKTTVTIDTRNKI